MKSYTQFKKGLFRNKKIKKAYEELGPEFEIVVLLIKRRLQQKLTQQELAKLLGTKQSAISRLESGTHNPSISLLHRVADALNAELKVSISAK